MTADEIYQAALTLPDESKALLAERLVACLVSNTDPEVEKARPESVRGRRDEILSGQVETLDGQLVMARARKRIERRSTLSSCGDRGGQHTRKPLKSISKPAKEDQCKTPTPR